MNVVQSGVCLRLHVFYSGVWEKDVCVQNTHAHAHTHMHMHLLIQFDEHKLPKQLLIPLSDLTSKRFQILISALFFLS